MMKILLYLIMALHILLVMFVILVPFFGNNYLLLMHAIVIPFIILHWITNNNTCALTLAEYKIREYLTGKPVDRSKCFMAKLIDPVYDFTQNHKEFSNITYFGAILLWAISIYKLYRNRKAGKLNSLEHLVLY